ncbi:MAG: hypothetical protein IKL00_01590, partial [Oscillospiraceae bacterium]|nr:hypothetical protein [Oscillospiraceae bacterium]
EYVRASGEPPLARCPVRMDTGFTVRNAPLPAASGAKLVSFQLRRTRRLGAGAEYVRASGEPPLARCPVRMDTGFTVRNVP